MNRLLALAFLATLSACGPTVAPTAPPGMPLEPELHPEDPDQALTRNLTAKPAPAR